MCLPLVARNACISSESNTLKRLIGGFSEVFYVRQQSLYNPDRLFNFVVFGTVMPKSDL
jgi:hypothetical protein